jgi:D-alanyl-D-alanine carboxypeptidase
MLALVASLIPVASGSGGARPQPRSIAAQHPTLHGVARHPDAVDVLVDKRVRLPAGFVPRRLVIPDVPFIFSGFDEKRQLRRVAARALERLFAAARADGVPLAAVSGYRSELTQRWLFEGYSGRMGAQAAARISSRPGYSEHETGLAIDVTGADGGCPASECFDGTRPARWLARHATAFGFVIRYPRGRERITGYAYEPWHLRYLGPALAPAVAAAGSYEEFLSARDATAG